MVTKLAVLRSAGRHLTAGTAAWVLYPVIMAVVDVVLVLIALVTNQDLGGPLFFPTSIAFAAAVGIASTVLIAFPAVLGGELASRQRGTVRAKVALYVFFASGIATALCGVYALLVGMLLDWPENGLVRFVVFLICMLPALLCYSTLNAVPKLLSSLSRMLRVRLS